MTMEGRACAHAGAGGAFGLAGLQRAVMGHAVLGCGCVQADRGKAPCFVRGDLSDRSAPVRHGHALALLLGIRGLHNLAAGRILVRSISPLAPELCQYLRLGARFLINNVRNNFFGKFLLPHKYPVAILHN